MHTGLSYVRWIVSIKAVVPALVPEVSYPALDGVADGSATSEAFLRIVTSAFLESESESQLRSSLLAYGCLDLWR